MKAMKKVEGMGDLETGRASIIPKVMDKEAMETKNAKVDMGWMVPRDYVAKPVAESDETTTTGSIKCGWSMTTGMHY